MKYSSLPSERSFGVLFTVVFALVSGYAWHQGAATVLFAASALASAMVLAATAFAPALLAPFNRAWFTLGVLLGRVANPIVLGVIFYLLITPVALAMRIAGRDALRIRRRGVESYWVERNPSGPDGDSFKNQF